MPDGAPPGVVPPSLGSTAWPEQIEARRRSPHWWLVHRGISAGSGMGDDVDEAKSLDPHWSPDDDD